MAQARNLPDVPKDLNDATGKARLEYPTSRISRARAYQGTFWDVQTVVDIVFHQTVGQVWRAACCGETMRKPQNRKTLTERERNTPAPCLVQDGLYWRRSYQGNIGQEVVAQLRTIG